ncbi:MAG: 1-acyl-sn-glycerol-3-phosphate acyltransferase [Clostridiales bacterium]|nr:1-acyl-sn-glycerol-3-phosphate acyltransferase [Clostridiales bacterium]
MSSKQKKKCKIGSNFFYDFVKVTAAIPALLTFRVKTIRENKNVPKKIKKGAVFAVNHTSYLDPVIIHCILWYRRLNFLATKELFNSKAKERFFKLVHCIPIDKNNFNIGAVHAVRDRLKEEKAIVIFPEGAVNREQGKIEEYKSGAVFMAHIAKKPLVPIYVVKGKKWYNRTVAVIGEPIDTTTICGKVPKMEDIDRASLYLHQKEEELKEIYYQRYLKKKV